MCWDWFIRCEKKTFDYLKRAFHWVDAIGEKGAPLDKQDLTHF